MKKFFSLVLALVMALSLTTVAWGAAANNDPTASESTVTLSDNLILDDDGWLDVEAGEVVTLNLNGKTLSREDGVGNLVIYVHDGGKLTVNGPGTIDATNLTDGMAIYSAGNGSSANVITLNNVTVKSSYFGVYHNGNNYGADVTINNSTVIDASAAGAGVFLSGQATWANKNALTITNSNISGATAVEVKQSDATVTNSTLTSTYTGTASLSSNGNGMCAVGYALALTNNATDATAGTVTVNSGTFKGAVGIKDSATTNEVGNATGATIAVKGGTFTDDVSAYVDADSGFTNNGDGTFSVAVKSAGSATYDLYEGDGDIYLEDVYRTKFAAKKLTKTQAGQVAGWDIEGTFYVEINKSEATNGDYYLTNHGKDKAILFLREAANHGAYTLTGKEYSNFGDDDCGEWTYDPDTTDMYVDSDGNYYVGGGVEYMLVGKTVVGVAAANDAYVVDHSMEGVYDKNDKLVSVKCSVCGATGKVYESVAKVPFGADYDFFDGLPYVLNKVAVKPADTETKVESAETFDAGIAMYVGMSVMAAAGSAVVLKKRED